MELQCLGPCGDGTQLGLPAMVQLITQQSSSISGYAAAPSSAATPARASHVPCWGMRRSSTSRERQRLPLTPASAQYCQTASCALQRGSRMRYSLSMTLMDGD